jgi:hypothetical protein
MSNAYDTEIFERSVEGSADFEIPIKSVQRYEVTDSNLGNYSSGQVKFNLNQLATSSSYIDWKKSHLVIPITLSVASTAATGLIGTSQLSHFYATLKSSFTSLLDSIVLSINNTEVVSKTGSLMNIPMYFNLMTSFDRNDIDVLGASMGFVPDSVESYRLETNGAARGELNNQLGNGVTFAPALNANTGRYLRHYKTVASLYDGITASFFGTAANFGRMNTSHKSYCDAAAGNNLMSNHIECCIPLRYVHSVFGVLPLMRGSSVQLLVNTHLPSSASFTVAADGSLNAAGARSTSSPNGFIPFIVSDPAIFLNTAAIQTITVRSAIGNTFNSQCQLRLSLCELNPEYESKLIKSPMKQVNYRDWYCFPNQTVGVTSGSTINQMLSVNIPKMRRLLIVPKIAVNSALAEWADAYQSPWTSAGCTTTPALITNLQVMLSGKPVYQSPLAYSWEQFLLECEGVNSVSGGIEDGLRAGLIDRQGYETIYGFALVNLSRKDSADDVIEKTIQITFTNNNTVAMSYSYFIEYERGWEIDVVSGKIVV